LSQMQFDHEPMMVRGPAMESVPQISPGRLQPPSREIGESIGISFARDQRIEDRPAAYPDDVTHDLRELQVGIFERLLNAQHMPRDFVHELSTRARQVAEFL